MGLVVFLVEFRGAGISVNRKEMALFLGGRAYRFSGSSFQARGLPFWGSLGRTGFFLVFRALESRQPGSKYPFWWVEFPDFRGLEKVQI